MIAEMQAKLGDYDAAISNYKEAEKAIAIADQDRNKLRKFSLESRLLCEVPSLFLHLVTQRKT